MTPQNIILVAKNPSIRKDHRLSRQARFSGLRAEFKASEISARTRVFLNYRLIGLKDTRIRKETTFVCKLQTSLKPSVQPPAQLRGHRLGVRAHGSVMSRRG